jgi:Molecular chaperone GrpE (heat shock protein)
LAKQNNNTLENEEIISENLSEETKELEVDEEVEIEDIIEDAIEEDIEDDAIIDSDDTVMSEDKKKGFFSKKKKKDKKDEQIDELNDRLKRSLAEFENFRKRTEKEKAAMYEIGAKSVIEKLLPVLDNFERGLATISDDEKSTAFADGMDMTYKQLVKLLEELGVTPIETVGKEFNPELHNAVMHIEDDEFDENTVCEEFQKGYMYRDSVVRYSMVKVAN